MADQAINALSTKTAPETSDQLLLVGTGEPQLIDYDKLADAILNKITSKKYALDAGQMTLLAALNKLNSDKLIRIRSKYTTNNDGIIPVHSMLTSMTIDNIVAVKAYSTSGMKNIYTNLYSYGGYAYALITDNNGNSIANTEFNIVVFYMK